MVERNSGSPAHPQDCRDNALRNLTDYLFVESGIIPLPDSTPIFTADGVRFVYQQYEIGPFLTKQALQLVE